MPVCVYSLMYTCTKRRKPVKLCSFKVRNTQKPQFRTEQMEFFDTMLQNSFDSTPLVGSGRQAALYILAVPSSRVSLPFAIRNIFRPGEPERDYWRRSRLNQCLRATIQMAISYSQLIPLPCASVHVCVCARRSRGFLSRCSHIGRSSK